MTPFDRTSTDSRTAELSEQQLDQVAGGSQSSGAGAGKVTFNPFSITRKVDKSTPIFF